MKPVQKPQFMKGLISAYKVGKSVIGNF